jgi:hypothetical protein
MEMRDCFPIATAPTERRLAREARSARMREQALALRRIGATYAAIGRVLSVCLERARRITLQAERLANAPRWYDSLPARALNFLRNHKLDGLPEVDAARAVAQLSRRELMRAPNFGAAACAALVAWLACHGLALQPESPRALRPIRNETSAPARGAPV